MRIIHVMPWYMPGHSYQENHLCYHQQRLGNEVWVITSDRIPRKFKNAVPNGYQPGLHLDHGVSIERLPVRLMVERILSLSEPVRSDDESDALAVAICRCHRIGVERVR